MEEPKVLYLTLNRRWYLLIESMKKPEEYREIKAYWWRRFLRDTRGHKAPSMLYNLISLQASIKIKYLEYKHFDIVHFKNGYSKTAPEMSFEFKSIEIREGNPDWGAVPGKLYFVISLGKHL